MPRYHFNVQEDRPIPDVAGIELKDLDAAKLHSLCVTAGILRDEAAAFWASGSWRIEVADELGNVLFALSILADGLRQEATAAEEMSNTQARSLAV